MSRLVLLDTGPLGMHSNPGKNAKNKTCAQRVRDLLSKGANVKVPEGADYEVRRKLRHVGATAGITRLDSVVGTLGLLRITREAWLKAAELWAVARAQG